MKAWQKIRTKIRDLMRLPSNVAAIAEQLGVSRNDHAATPDDLSKAMCASALAKTVTLIEREMPGAIIHGTHEAFLADCLEKAPLIGAHCEFGVYSGVSINFLSSIRTEQIFDGFDSFRGLPSEWSGYRLFDFNRRGEMPAVRGNVRLHIGLFDDTLPAYARSVDSVAFLHVDCDLYSSTVSIFRHLGPKLSKGTVIVFDEYFGYPGFELHERKAFSEFLASSGLDISWFACCGQRAACVIV